MSAHEHSYGSESSQPALKAEDGGFDGPGHEQHTDPDSSGPPKTRLRKACDSCSLRKIKCDLSGPPCQPCASLNIPCTWNRPTRRRGPPNRHAEAIKRQRIEDTGPIESELSAPASPTNAAHTLTAIARGRPLSAESICPMVLLQPLVDDYFTYIHPLIPVPHEPTFRAALNEREDTRNPRFLSLLAAMIGGLVVSFPRKPRQHLKAQGQENLFPKSVNLLNRCQTIVGEARGIDFLHQKHDINDAVTSYLLALMSGYNLQMGQATLYLHECMGLVYEVGTHKDHPDAQSELSNPMGQHNFKSSSNYVSREISRRVFWVMFVGIRSCQQLGLLIGAITIPPQTVADPYPPLPLEIDDRYIFTDHIKPQPPDVTSELVGFNANVQLFRSCDPLEHLSYMFNIGRHESWAYQIQVFQDTLAACKTLVDMVPLELQLLRPGQQSANFGVAVNPGEESARNLDTHTVHPHPYEPVSPSQRWDTDRTSHQRRWLQYEIQKANIYATQLGIRSHIVDRFWGLYDSQKHILDVTEHSTTHSDSVTSHMAAERELIVQDLLIVIRSINQVNMEPNGASIIHKIRHIASSLLDLPRSRKGTLALRAQDYLIEIVELLMKLERIPSVKRGPSSSDDDAGCSETGASLGDEEEEAELQHWADLRDMQKRFLVDGGSSKD